MKWFMSYVQDYGEGRRSFGHTVSDRGKEHPIETVERWQREYGAKDGFTVVLLSFAQVDDSMPEQDVLTRAG